MNSPAAPGGDAIPARKRERSLRASVWDAAFYAAMVGFGETYFLPLLVFLGASNMQVGIFSAAPQLGVAFSQFVSILLIERFAVRKRIIVAGASFQALILVAILSGLLAGRFSPWLFVALAVVYFVSNGTVIPAWNSLIGDLTTPENRGAYFGRRGGLSQLVSFLAMFCAGWTVQHFVDAGNGALGFSIIIGAALAARAGSIYSLSHHFEVPYRDVPDAHFSFWDFLRRSPKSNFAHFVFFVGLMTFSVHVAAPFFVVYMIRDLHLSYFQYTIAQGVFIATQFIAMRRWGPFADRYGNRMVLRISATITPFVPLMWLFSKSFSAILLYQFIAGLAWAGWALATANFIFDAVTPPKRARCAAYLNFFNSMGIFGGSLLGAFLSTRAPAGFETGVMKITFVSNLIYLFLVSSLLRFIVVFLFMPTIREVREVRKDNARDMFMMLTNIRPFHGARFVPFTGAGHRENNGEKKNGNIPGE